MSEIKKWHPWNKSLKWEEQKCRSCNKKNTGGRGTKQNGYVKKINTC
jgi:hypothetical protein